MSKKEFLLKLTRALKKLEKQEREKYISYYDEIISDMMEGGISEQEAIGKQGSIDDIAREIFSDMDGERLVKRDRVGITLTVAAVILAAASIACIWMLPDAGVLSLINEEGPTAVFMAGRIREPIVLYIAAGCAGLADIAYHAVRHKKRGLLLGILAVLCVGGMLLLRDIIKEDGGNYTENDMFTNCPYTEADIEERARIVIDLLNAEDYETLCNQYAAEEMKAYMAKAVFDEAKQTVSGDWGEFIKNGNIYSGEVTQNGIDYVVVEVNSIYDKVSVVYTIVFDRDMKIAGLYMR